MHCDDNLQILTEFCNPIECNATACADLEVIPEAFGEDGDGEGDLEVDFDTFADIDRVIMQFMPSLTDMFQAPMAIGEVRVVQPQLLLSPLMLVSFPYDLNFNRWRLVQRAWYTAGHTCKIVFITCGDKVVFKTTEVPDADEGFGPIVWSRQQDRDLYRVLQEREREKERERERESERQIERERDACKNSLSH
jgi:hypothetical protein